MARLSRHKSNGEAARTGCEQDNVVGEIDMLQRQQSDRL